MGVPDQGPSNVTQQSKARIDTLQRGAIVRLTDAKGGDETTAMFVGIIGSGDDRRARFVTTSKGGGPGGDSNLIRDDHKGYYEWEAYRYNGYSGNAPSYWAYGSSADRLRLAEVIA